MPATDTSHSSAPEFPRRKDEGDAITQSVEAHIVTDKDEGVDDFFFFY